MTSPDIQLDELFTALAMLDADDPDSCASLLDELSEVLAIHGLALEDSVRDTLLKMRDLTIGLTQGTAEDPGAAVRQLQELGKVLEKGSQPPPQARDDTFVLPDGIPEDLLGEFLGDLQSTLDELEAFALELENGPEPLEAIRRKVHTMKGEAGMLGLTDLSAACHGLEDLLADEADGARQCSMILAFKDWAEDAARAYQDGRLPQIDARRAVASFASAASDEPPATDDGGQTEGYGVTSPPPPSGDEPDTQQDQATAGTATPQRADGQGMAVQSSPAKAGVDGGPVEAPEEDVLAEYMDESIETGMADVLAAVDEEMLPLYEEFLQEGDDGLAKADEVLLEIEDQGPEPERINALFRVFHTIKGVSGFLELKPITRLAHTTETLLNQVRQDERPMDGTVLDLVFDSTAMMRRLMGFVRNALESGEVPPKADGLALLMAKLQATIDGKTLPEPKLPEVGPDTPIGRILTTPPINIPEEAVEKALDDQIDTGRRLGEELLAQNLAKPKQVAQALRVQKKAHGKVRETVKIDLERVDGLVEMIGELVIVESMVVNAPEITAISSPRVQKFLAQLGKITRDLQDVGMRMRMVPVRSVFQKMARMVRDLARKSGKDVRLVTAGEGTEMDRSMVEQIADPLVHMIRNAVDHGIEPPEEREAAGKPRTGTVTLSAYHEGGGIVIEIADDGRGLDREAILSKALSKGLVSKGEDLSESEIFSLIFAPGFSTAKKVTDISGRGVGMDVVRKNIDAMRGRISITSTPGEGTTFKIVLPLTLAIIEGMLVSCGKERYIIPTLSIIESIQVTDNMLVTFADRGELLNVRGQIVPLLRLHELFSIEGAIEDPPQGLVVILEGVGQRIGLLVDDVLTQQQVVIKSLGSGLKDTEFVSGGAILSDGRVGLILNVEQITSSVIKNSKEARRRGGRKAVSAA